ncbi:SIMPL domain-containing protein [Natronolimnohabitans sp. A-GB9]|uniref:SIMPL domain-containing protein n=1 Tax=Natronolimnohabitans sp. A-GB9 TaxID=3069757 RepID=UPI0027B34F99|nr:SIMPL domain-containing protein [Natronolimnohabitans sp. A-GB9]MDQ2052209.1 SIMPL domain-containing protein [Natronolimnohabitans sp. A-GB9]
MTQRTITTTATGRTEEQPTNATVEITAEGYAESATGAHATVTDRAQTIVRELVGGPITEDQIRATSHRVEPPDQQFEPAEPDKYRGTRELAVNCQPDRVTEVATVAMEAGGTILNAQFELPDERVAALRNDAVADAVVRARTRAERIASTEGGTVGDVVAVTTAGTDDGGMQSIVEDALDSCFDTDFQPSSVVVTEAVEATFELDES